MEACYHLFVLLVFIERKFAYALKFLIFILIDFIIVFEIRCLILCKIHILLKYKESSFQWLPRTHWEFILFRSIRNLSFWKGLRKRCLRTSFAPTNWGQFEVVVLLFHCALADFRSCEGWAPWGTYRLFRIGVQIEQGFALLVRLRHENSISVQSLFVFGYHFATSVTSLGIH